MSGSVVNSVPAYAELRNSSVLAASFKSAAETQEPTAFKCSLILAFILEGLNCCGCTVCCLSYNGCMIQVLRKVDYTAVVQVTGFTVINYIVRPPA